MNKTYQLEKLEVAKKFAQKNKDTGSPEVQVALITHRINHLSKHFKAAKKDHSGRRGLLALVGQRKRLLSYLKSRDLGRYNKLIQALELRK